MDFIEKLATTFPVSIRDETKQELLDLAEKVQVRFQMFTALVMWHLELQKMEDELSGECDIDQLISRSSASGSGGGKKDDGFSAMVSLLMSADMQRTDGIEENLEFLQSEINDMEKDVCLMGMMLGRTVAEKEKTVFYGGEVGRKRKGKMSDLLTDLSADDEEGGFGGGNLSEGIVIV